MSQNAIIAARATHPSTLNRYFSTVVCRGALGCEWKEEKNSSSSSSSCEWEGVSNGRLARVVVVGQVAAQRPSAP